MGLEIFTAPTDYPVSLVEMKDYLNVEFDDDDTKIGMMLADATQIFDGPFGELQRALMPQVWYYFRDAFPAAGTNDCCSCNPCASAMPDNCNGIELPLPPLISVDEVAYSDPDTGLYTAMAADAYQASTNGYRGWVQPTEAWPSPMQTIDAVRIKFTAGYAVGGNPAVPNVPADLKGAIMMLVHSKYEQRGEYVVGQSVSDLPRGVETIIRRYRVIPL